MHQTSMVATPGRVTSCLVLACIWCLSSRMVLIRFSWNELMLGTSASSCNDSLPKLHWSALAATVNKKSNFQSPTCIFCTLSINIFWKNFGKCSSIYFLFLVCLHSIFNCNIENKYQSYYWINVFDYTQSLEWIKNSFIYSTYFNWDHK